jgi:CheY-like chemotaxis protein
MDAYLSGDPPPRLLIVDDVADNREILRRLFERRGLAVVEAAGGEEALGLIDAEPFDAVLLDMQMPDLNGLQVLRRIRTRRSPLELPVIFVTGQTQQADVQAAIEAGANDFVAKPVDFDLAFARVQAQLRKRTAMLPPEPGTPVLYTFPEMGHSVPPHPVMGVAEETLVLSCLSVEQLMARLGGCARYVSDGGQVYLGVWGEKNVERLRVVLAARAPKLLVRRERPPACRLEWRRTGRAA